MERYYKAGVASLYKSSFCASSVAIFSRFRKKDKTMTAELLNCPYIDSFSEMRNVLPPLFQRDLVTMKSGRDCNVLVTNYTDDEEYGAAVLQKQLQRIAWFYQEVATTLNSSLICNRTSSISTTFDVTLQSYLYQNRTRF
jgi:hypothetical protein